MAVPKGLSRILNDVAPKRINKVSQQIIKILFKINTVLSEINSIDFCNPLGYILSKALPPGGLLEAKLLKYGKDALDFVNNLGDKLNPLKLKSETPQSGDTPEQIVAKDKAYKDRIQSYQASIEEIRLSLEDIIPPDDLIEIIPGGEGLAKTIQSINLALVATSDAIDPTTDIINKISILKSFARKLTPFLSPINIATLALGGQEAEINKKLAGIIKPERFRESVGFLVNQVKAIDKAIVQIQATVKLINTILRVINILIKVYKFVIKILKFNPTPTAIGGPSPVISVPIGVMNTQSDRISKSNQVIDDLEKIIGQITKFLSGTILLNIKRIRREILRLLTGLNILYKNLRACQYTSNDTALLNTVQGSIDSLNNNLIILDELFPTAKGNATLPSLYNGYTINILKEEVVDEGITLLRRRVIVADQRGVIEYEGTATYAPDDQILIKEGQYYIDKQNQTRTSDTGNDSPTDQEVIDIVNISGLNSNNTLVGPVTPD
jgi:prefoldin subunit 5